MAKLQFMFDITEANKVRSGDNMVIWTQGVPRQEQEERETAGQQDSRPAGLPVIKKRSLPLLIVFRDSSPALDFLRTILCKAVVTSNVDNNMPSV